MTSEPDPTTSEPHPSATARPDQPGPKLLTERTLSGIFVHFFGLGTGFLVPALVYLVSEREFTRSNARNAFNWQVLFSGTFAALLALLVTGIAIESAAPADSPLGLVAVGFVIASATGLFAFGVVFLVNVLFALTAMTKAIFGTAWRYPLAPDALGWLESRFGGRIGGGCFSPPTPSRSR